MVETRNDFTEFCAKFDTLSDGILKELVAFGMPNDAIAWVRQCLKYNVPGGKMNRGLSVLSSYRLLLGRELTEDETLKATVLGWSIEWLQAFFLVADDIMDGSKTRRGQPCWFRLEDVGMIAVNDSLLIEGTMYRILKKYFRNEKYYVDLLELLHEVTYQTELGQTLDLITAPEGKVNLDRFSLDRYRQIVKHKTAYYSFYLPVALAMLMAGYTAEKEFKGAEEILLEMGEFFQIQDDYLDCYGDPEVIGKIGTDIEDNKCGWLVVQALERCTPEQRAILEANYARKDPANVAAVKALYADLDLRRVYSDYEESSFVKLQAMINASTVTIPKEIFTDFARKIYKRQK